MDFHAFLRILPLCIFGWLVLVCIVVHTAPVPPPLTDTGSELTLLQEAPKLHGYSVDDLLKNLPNIHLSNNCTSRDENATIDHPIAGEDEDEVEEQGNEGVKVVSWNFEEVATPLIISLFMLFAGIFKLFFHHFEWLSSKVPESCMLILVGTGVGAILHYIVQMDDLKMDPHMFMMYLLPPIVLDAAYGLHDREFFNNVGTILLYAVVGTVLNWALIGPTLYGLSLVGALGSDIHISFLQCLIFASFIVAVDPVAVLAIFQEVGVNNELYFLVFGESLLNDAVTIVLYDMMLAFGGMTHIPSSEMGVGVASFFTVSLGGALVGIVFGILTCILTRFTYYVRVVEPLAMIMVAYLSYLCGALFHWSGLISMICCGLIQAQYAFHNISRKSLTTVQYFMKMLSSTSDAVIFLFLGLELMRTEHHWTTGFALCSLGLCLVYRLVSVFGLTFLVNKFVRAIPISFQEQFIMWYGGLRGAVCFALCATLPMDFEFRSMFLTTTLLIIFFTVFIQGMTVKPFVSCCNISMKQDDELHIAEEVNQLVTDHVMAGMEAVIGQFMGDNYVRQMVVRLNDKYLRRWLMRNPMTQEERILQVYHEVALQDHMYNMEQGSAKPIPSLLDVDAEKADMKEKHISDQDSKQENGVLPHAFTPETILHKFRRSTIRRKRNIAAILDLAGDSINRGLKPEDTIYGLQLAIMGRSYSHRHDRNLTHEDDTDLDLVQLQNMHERIRDARRTEQIGTTELEEKPMTRRVTVATVPDSSGLKEKIRGCMVASTDLEEKVRRATVATAPDPRRIEGKTRKMAVVAVPDHSELEDEMRRTTIVVVPDPSRVDGKTRRSTVVTTAVPSGKKEKTRRVTVADLPDPYRLEGATVASESAHGRGPVQTPSESSVATVQDVPVCSDADHSPYVEDIHGAPPQCIKVNSQSYTNRAFSPDSQSYINGAFSPDTEEEGVKKDDVPTTKL